MVVYGPWGPGEQSVDADRQLVCEVLKQHKGDDNQQCDVLCADANG